MLKFIVTMCNDFWNFFNPIWVFLGKIVFIILMFLFFLLALLALCLTVLTIIGVVKDWIKLFKGDNK